MRKQLHPGCSCRMCKLGKGASGCKPTTARKLRRTAAAVLRGISYGSVAVDREIVTVVRGGYTD